MWTQMIVLCTSGVIQVVSVGVFTLTPEGERTPDMLYAALVRLTRLHYVDRMHARALPFARFPPNSWGTAES